MEHLIAFSKRTMMYVCLLQFSICATFAQQPSSSARCQVSTSPPQVRAEGLTERLGDILLQCSGSTPGALFNGNFTLFFPVNVTNRVDANNLTRDAVVSVDLGSGFFPTAIAGQVSGSNISFNGISFTAPASGNVNVKISNIRAAMNQLGLTSAVPAQVTAQLSSSLAVDKSQFVVAFSQAGLFSSLSSTTITCVGSPAPDTFDLPSLFAAGTAFSSTRVTEGFATAFEARTAGVDTGTRFLVKYTGFPATTHLFIPDAVAGSDALQPTAGGDMTLPQAVGQYMPGSGALVLVRVTGADSTGAGGSAVAPPQGSAPVTLGSVSEVALTNGAGYAVYEVAAANPSVQESAQFPTFVSLPRFTPPAVAQETVGLAPVSSVTTASATAPVPRFTAVAMQSDCKLLGDCTTPFVAPPKLSLEASPIHISAVSNGGAMTSAPGTFRVHNTGTGNMDWSISVIYQGTAPGSAGWLIFAPPSGTNEATVQVTANTKTLTPGISLATIIVNGGAAGSQSLAVILTVTAVPATPAPPVPVTPNVIVSQVLNAATLQVAPLVIGSLTTLMGSHLSGTSVAVTFDGISAALLYTSDTQINLQVPSALGSNRLGAKNSTSLVVTVDGVSSTPQTIPLAVAWPAVFPHGVFNQDNRENTPSTAAKSGDILQIFATGIPNLATVSVQIGDSKDLVPLYAGDAPTAPGVQQVNVAVPAGVTGALPVQLCATTGGQQYCSPAYTITVQ
jgi:uncharacterized protein (TIGR03437 family)